LFGVVTQETYLYNDTIINNITFGNSASMDEVIYAAKIANIHDFISNLPEQYFTIIGDRGVKLSGGQRQRLAIARAVYKKPDILVFDEATSALDNKSEKIVQKAIENVIKNCTTLIIAHRLSTIKNADKILVIDNGRIVESGDHKELLNLNGVYKNLYDIHILEHEK
jgi:subfamily B ATP-binding cassette protein MsbA